MIGGVESIASAVADARDAVRDRGRSRTLAADRYVPSLDGLRACSILLVVVSHMGFESAVPGAFGVTLFFFISGLLITDQLIAQIRRTGTVALANFYMRRFLRLMPAAVVFILVSGLVFVAIGGRITLAGWLSALFYGGNYYDLFATYDTTVSRVRHPFLIIWSLAIEEHYYLFWPVALLLLRPGRRAIAAIVLVCVASFLWRLWLYDHCFGAQPGAVCGLRIHDRLYKGTDTRLDSIGWGALVALLAASNEVLLTRVRRGRGLQLVMLAVLASTFLIRGEEFRQVPRYALQGVALAVLVPAVILDDNPLRRVLETNWATFIGRLSYSMYLWHWGALAVADYLVGEGGMAWRAIAAVLTTAFSLASYYGIEQPMLKLRRRFGSHATR